MNEILWPALIWYFSGLEFWIFENCVVTDHTVVTQGFCVGAIIQYCKHINIQWLSRLMDAKYINRELMENISRGYFRDKQDKTVILSNSHIILLHGTTLWEMSDSLIIKIINESCLAWVIMFMLQWPWPLSTKAYN